MSKGTSELSLMERLISRALDRLGTGWKSILGLGLMTAVLIAKQMGWIGGDQAADLYGWMTVVFGVGVVHRQTRLTRANK